MGWTSQNIPDQTGRIALITGSNSGVGYESAVALARNGAQVIMACRSAARGEAARADLLARVPNAAIDVMPLDLGSLDSIRAFAADFNNKHDRLDILMLNAGVMVPPFGKTADGFEMQIGTNHLGHFALTGLVLPRVLSTPASRVVTVSSGAYLNGRIDFDDLHSDRRYVPWTAYSQSKLANILFSQELHRRLQSINSPTISVASHPGYAITNLQKHVSGFQGLMMNTVFRPIMSHTPEVGATYQLFAATDPSVKSGEFYGPRYGVRGEVVRLNIIPTGRDTATASRLWHLSEDLTAVHYETLGAAVASAPV